MSDSRPRILLVRSFDPEEHGGTKYGTGQRLSLFEESLRAIGDLDIVQAEPSGAWAGWPIYRHTWGFEDATIAPLCKWDLRKYRPDEKAVKKFDKHRPQDYDVVFLHRLAAAWWTGWTDPHRTIVDLDDIPSHYYQQNAQQEGNPVIRFAKWLRYLRFKITERRMPNAFRFVLVCSEKDQEYMGHPHVKVISNSYRFNNAMEKSPKPGVPGAMLFVGTLRYWANVRGLAWFVRQVLPLVRESVPEAKLVVVGLNPSPNDTEDMSWSKDPGVEFIGEVDDVAPYIQDACFEICPLLHGCGTRIKIVESLAYGKPVVGTNIGAYGWPMGEEDGVFRRDTPQGFAKVCIDLLKQTSQPYLCGLQGRNFIQEHYRPEAIAKRLNDLVQTILKEQGPVVNR